MPVGNVTAADRQFEKLCRQVSEDGALEAARLAVYGWAQGEATRGDAKASMRDLLAELDS